MNWSDLPPLAALRAFAAFAETQSVSAAGAKLNVSHAAISQHIRALEAHLNIALVERRGRTLVLTADGRALAHSATAGFGTILETVQALSAREDDRPLQISCTPSFASFWLMPRLAEFRKKNSQINMMIDPNPAVVALSPGGIDVAIRFGNTRWPGLDSTMLLPTTLVVVAAADMFDGALPSDPSELTHLPWLNEGGTNEASTWLDKHGIEAGQRPYVTNVPGNLVLDGLRNGQGIAMVTRLAIAEDLAAGRMVVLFEEDTGAGYHLVTRPGVQRPALKAFCRWIQQEAAKT